MRMAGAEAGGRAGADGGVELAGGEHAGHGGAVRHGVEADAVILLQDQAPHQVELVRLLAGSPARSVWASAGIWDAARRTEGAYAAHLVFADGAFASLTYNGQGHFDTGALHGWMGELGQQRGEGGYGEGRARLRGLDPVQEAALKNKRAYGQGRHERSMPPWTAAPPRGGSR